MKTIDLSQYEHIVFFTGAGMSAESGVPTYRGSGGIWNQYRWEEYACQEAFNADPGKVLKFHELRRAAVLACNPHAGHFAIAALEKKHQRLTVVTQNIDGMHQRAGNRNVIELHGSLWRLRCTNDGTAEDIGEKYKSYKCAKCGGWLRPDIIWFGDMLDQGVMSEAIETIQRCNLFISIGTSGVVYPAAGFPQYAKENNARCIEINPEANEMSFFYDEAIRDSAGKALPKLLGWDSR
jgi:NAD-dependent deacetylase